MLEFLNEIFERSDVRMLRDEITRERADNERLRSENRALVNSLLGTAGFPPVDFPAVAAPRELPRTRRRSWPQIQQRKEQQSAQERA
jgi:hypothetical protein